LQNQIIQQVSDLKRSVKRKPEWYQCLCTNTLAAAACWHPPQNLQRLELQGEITKVQYYAEMIYSYKTSLPPESKEMKAPLSVKYGLLPYITKMKREKLKNFLDKAIAQVKSNVRHQSIYNACDLLCDSTSGARMECTLKYGDWNLEMEGISLKNVNEDIHIIESNMKELKNNKLPAIIFLKSIEVGNLAKTLELCIEKKLNEMDQNFSPSLEPNVINPSIPTIITQENLAFIYLLERMREFFWKGQQKDVASNCFKASGILGNMSTWNLPKMGDNVSWKEGALKWQMNLGDIRGFLKDCYKEIGPCNDMENLVKFWQGNKSITTANTFDELANMFVECT
jgi:hypothetical protein